MNLDRVVTLVLAALLLSLPGAAMAQNKYVGADRCKGCHSSKDIGAQYPKWKQSPHAKAWPTLAGDRAKQIAQARGIADPQKDPKCVKCHVTAFAAPAAEKAPTLKNEQGVGCESCHGPGEKHAKARMASEDENAKVPPGEIVANPGEKVCLGCHNKESPTYKPFVYSQAVKAIAHPIPPKQ